MTHVLCEFFRALFKFGNIFSKNSFFDPIVAPFLKKNLKILDFLKSFFGGMWHMFYIQFFQPFSVLEVSISKFKDSSVLCHKKGKKNFSPFGGCGTCLVSNF